MFALVDCNNFFVSCERVFNPRLQGVPVAVMSNNDGCIIARSDEVKRLGIPMGVPIFKVKDELQRHQVKVLSANFDLYGNLSARVFAICAGLVPQMEQYSIDEAFLDLRGVTDPEPLCRLLRQRILDWTGLPVSIGIASTKTLCKIANHIAKKASHHQGVLLLDRPALIDAALEATPVEDIWGVGRNLAPQLRRWGLGNARQLRDLDPKIYRARTNVIGEQMVLELRGQSCLGLNTTQEARKSIISSRSFGKRVTELHDLKEAVAYHAAQAARKLRDDNSHVTGLAVFVKTQLGMPSLSHALRLPSPTDHTPDLITAAQQLVAELFQPGLSYRKTGIMLFDIQPASYQASLFAEGPNLKQKKLMQTIDRVNSLWGKDFLRFAATGIKRPWQSKVAQRSPRYTTCFTELLKVG